MRSFNKIRVIENRAVSRGILHDCAKNCVVEFETGEVVDLDFNSERLGAGANDFNRLRMTIVADKKNVPIGSSGVVT